MSSSRENYAGRQDDRALDLVRAYLDITFRDVLRLRAGRFLTPVGQWNEIHAEPLTWTSVRPLATYRSFAKYTTGAMLAGQGTIRGHDVGYAAWASPGGLDNGSANEVQFGPSVGARAAAEILHGVWLGASVASLREHRPYVAADQPGAVERGAGAADTGTVEQAGVENDDDRGRTARALAGLDLKVQAAGSELLAEATWLGHGRERAAERAAFAQLEVPVLYGFHAVGRSEVFSPLEGRQALMQLAGLAWRGPRGFTAKLEYQFTDRQTPRVARGWFFSLSSLF